MIKRQGDLLIVKIDRIPEDALSRESRVLAEGEATGHMHELDSGEVYGRDGMLYFKVAEGGSATLKHPEHKPVEFDEGSYRVVRQREYEPKAWRYVSD